MTSEKWLSAETMKNNFSRNFSMLNREIRVGLLVWLLKIFNTRLVQETLIFFTGIREYLHETWKINYMSPTLTLFKNKMQDFSMHPHMQKSLYSTTGLTDSCLNIFLLVQKLISRGFLIFYFFIFSSEVKERWQDDIG